MAYVGVDKNGSEWIFEHKPDRDARIPIWLNGCDYMELPKGSIAKLIGRELTWDDEPVELVEDKPQKVEHNFKVGDIVRYKAPTPNDYCDNEIFTISEIGEDCFAFFEDYEKGYHVRVLEHWEPMLNEWCWFWDDGLTHSAHLMQFHSKHELSLSSPPLYKRRLNEEMC